MSVDVGLLPCGRPMSFDIFVLSSWSYVVMSIYLLFLLTLGAVVEPDPSAVVVVMSR